MSVAGKIAPTCCEAQDPFEIERVARALAERAPNVEQASQRAAVALILKAGAPCEGGTDALYILRAEHPKDPWSGQMGLPGGRREPGDATLLDTARRETREEIGVDLERDGRLLGQLDDVRAMARGRHIDLAITPFVFELTGDVRVQRNQREVQEVHWIDFASLRDPSSASTLPYEHEGKTCDLPCYRVADRVVWGLTYRMLQIFFSLLGVPDK